MIYSIIFVFITLVFIAFYLYYKNKTKYDLNDYATVEYPNGSIVRLYKNLNTNIYEEVNNT